MIFFAQECEDKIGYTFNDKMLLRKCFTHSSYSNEHKTDNNEVLEFFGDAIIQFVVTEFLYENYHVKEGSLTKKRIEMVSKEPLLKAIKELDLGKYMLFGKGQGESFNYEEKLFSSLYEAIVAGIYLDGGMKPCKKFIERTIIKDFKQSETQKNKQKDDKTLFQEYVQKYRLGSIRYETLARSGPDHNPVFKVAVLLNENVLAESTGNSKKQAETYCAGIALKKLKQDK